MNKEIINLISNVTNTNFIVLSTHDDIDILADNKYKKSIINVFESLGFRGETKNPQSECLYYAEHDIQFFKDDFDKLFLTNSSMKEIKQLYQKLKDTWETDTPFPICLKMCKNKDA